MNVFVSSVAFYMNVFVSHVYCLIESLVSFVRCKDMTIIKSLYRIIIKNQPVFYANVCIKHVFLLSKIFSSKNRPCSCTIVRRNKLTSHTPHIIHERIAHVLLDILLYDMLKCVFRHFLYSSEGSFKIERIDKTETVLSNILVTNNISKCV